MARRRGSTVIEGVTGLFTRTPEAWRALGAPMSLYDRAAAARAYARCATQGFSLKGLGDGPGPAGIAASRWWHSARPLFLARAAALTPDESAKIAASPRFYAISACLDEVAVYRELRI